MFVRNCWYMIAWDHEIPQEQANGHIFSRTVLGEPIVVYRASSGLVALADRCVHRGAPLSKGRLEGDNLRCGYHGLVFNPQGQCRWIFVWMGEPEKADVKQLPDNFSCDSPDWKNVPGYMHYDTNYLLICDNLLDFSHLSYVHEKTLGGSLAIAQARPTVDEVTKEGQRGLRLQRSVSEAPPSPFYNRIHPFKGLLDRWWDYEFLLPGTLLMKSGGRPSKTNTLDTGEVELHSCQTVTPETENSTHYFFQQGHKTGQGDDTLAQAMHEILIKAFHEDKDMIGAQSACLDLAPDFEMLPLHLDGALTRFRRLIESEIARERSA
jgi:phenylpropionate dioxygenase-like ring-hydroxylating dioxygenase large terminal subunit